jgi:hypothetical protein
MLAKDGEIEHMHEQNALLIQRLFGRKFEKSADADSLQLAVFNEAEKSGRTDHDRRR